MEKFKVDHFKEENVGKMFPEYKSLSTSDCEAIKQNIQKKTTLLEKVELVKWIRINSVLIEGVDADSVDFNFKSILQDLQIDIPDTVFINWHQFDEIDEFDFEDFNTYFKYIWYPGPDDIEIFTKKADWIISIDESGSLYMYKQVLLRL